MGHYEEIYAAKIAAAKERARAYASKVKATSPPAEIEIPIDAQSYGAKVAAEILEHYEQFKPRTQPQRFSPRVKTPRPPSKPLIGLGADAYVGRRSYAWTWNAAEQRVDTEPIVT